MLERLMHNTCMNRLDNARRSQVIRCLVEGTSVRATVRMTGVAKKTVLRLLCEIGEVCREVQDVMFRGLTCRRIQIDEIWSFCGAKEKIASAEKKAQGWGDVWTWVAIDADTKIVPSWLVGKRDTHCAIEFVNDLAGRQSVSAESWRILMKLEVASIEAPEFVLAPDYVQKERSYHPQYETIQDKTFEGGWMVVDNRQFQNCKFLRVHFVYSGGLFGFRDCEIDAESVLSLTGSAARSLALWKAFVQHPERKPFPF